MVIPIISHFHLLLAYCLCINAVRKKNEPKKHLRFCQILEFAHFLDITRHAEYGGGRGLRREVLFGGAHTQTDTHMKAQL